MTVSVAASGAFRDRIRDVFRPHVEAAKAGWVRFGLATVMSPA